MIDPETINIDNSKTSEIIKFDVHYEYKKRK
jgi:hypothetical protein